MEITAKWEVSYKSGNISLDLDDLGCQSEEEWNSLEESEREERIQEAIDDRADAPSMILASYE